MKNIKYPYLPKGKKILYVKPDNKFMKEATRLLALSGCFKQPTAAVIVKNRKIIGRGMNAGSAQLNYCPRDLRGCKTGEGYELCKIYCGQVGHAEITAIKDALKNKVDLKGADIYIEGHWWCCKNCWDAMIKAGIKNVYFRKDSAKLYKKDIEKEKKNKARIIDSSSAQKKIIDKSATQRKISSEYIKRKLGAELKKIKLRNKK